MTDEGKPFRAREGQSGRRPASETYPRADTSTGRNRHPRTGQFLKSGHVPNKRGSGSHRRRSR